MKDLGQELKEAKRCHAEISRFISDSGVVWTQGAGGNVSVSMSRQRRLIKKSGLRLSQVTEELGWIQIDEFKLREKMVSNPSMDESTYSQLLEDVILLRDSSGLGRPSMEAGLHILGQKKFFVHFHSLVAVLMAEILLQSDQFVIDLRSQLSGTVFSSFAVIDFDLPGLQLAKKLQNHKEDVLFLRKHGILLQINDVSELQLWKEMEIQICKKMQWLELQQELEAGQRDLQDFLSVWEERFDVYFPDVAVFLLSMQKSLQPSGKPGYFRWKNHFSNSDLNLQELWVATCLLQRSSVVLSALSSEQQEIISQLPTERFRQLELLNKEGYKS